jgi:hypothetical protein
VPDEYIPALSGRTPIAEVSNERVPKLHGQRQFVCAKNLTGIDPHGTCAPMEIIQSQIGHFAGTQPKDDLTQRHRIVPEARRLGTVECRQELANLVFAERLG